MREITGLRERTYILEKKKKSLLFFFYSRVHPGAAVGCVSAIRVHPGAALQGLTPCGKNFFDWGHDLAVQGVSRCKVDMIFIIFREFNMMLEIVENRMSLASLRLLDKLGQYKDLSCHFINNCATTKVKSCVLEW